MFVGREITTELKEEITAIIKKKLSDEFNAKRKPVDVSISVTKSADNGTFVTAEFDYPLMGWLDNPATMCREQYNSGNLVQHITAIAVEQLRKQGQDIAPWGHFAVASNAIT